MMHGQCGPIPGLLWHPMPAEWETQSPHIAGLRWAATHRAPITGPRHLPDPASQALTTWLAGLQSPDDNSDDEAEKEEGEVEGAGPDESKEARLEARREQRRQNELQAMARLRLLGNMQFVGYLFKKKMLTEKIMHYCIQDLLKEVRSCRQTEYACRKCLAPLC